MLKDALEYMAEIGRKSANKIVTTDAEPKHVYFIRKEDGTLEKHEAAAFPVAHQAFSLQAIIEKAKEADVAEVWYAPAKIVCVFGEDVKRDRITLDIKNSDPLAMLISLRDQPRQMAQAEIVRHMRTTFRQSLSEAGNLAETLSKVNFKATSETEGVIQHGKASLGKSIVNEVTGLKIIPEYVKFNFTIYANPCFKAIRGTVECALEPDVSNGTFRLIPLPGEIDNALDTALSEVAEMLVTCLSTLDIKILHGTP